MAKKMFPLIGLIKSQHITILPMQNKKTLSKRLKNLERNTRFRQSMPVYIKGAQLFNLLVRSTRWMMKPPQKS